MFNIEKPNHAGFSIIIGFFFLKKNFSIIKYASGYITLMPNIFGKFLGDNIYFYEITQRY
jgi:hypothetical protein